MVCRGVLTSKTRTLPGRTLCEDSESAGFDALEYYHTRSWRLVRFVYNIAHPACKVGLCKQCRASVYIWSAYAEQLFFVMNIRPSFVKCLCCNCITALRVYREMNIYNVFYGRSKSTGELLPFYNTHCIESCQPGYS